ncbi:hypothetical protein [Devosia rhizoryzae]|uniref:LPXTG cell wall anchor domain-containing protein n=1 Tax=Devosia rhizoryzae TaxID=2774137 RepID=A0ABX7C709_9HYPH|nr:hypothetical protein [Devosia rhizoryzae]QQR39044.1 hypothetical protein JI748_15095 [Devosia rhizoryzae]
MSQEIIYVVGAVLLLAALAYGVMQSRNRKKGERSDHRQSDAGHLQEVGS